MLHGAQKLSLSHMEELAAQSQPLVDRAMANALTPDDLASPHASVKDGESSDTPNPRCTGTDVDRLEEGEAPSVGIAVRRAGPNAGCRLAVPCRGR